MKIVYIAIFVVIIIFIVLLVWPTDENDNQIVEINEEVSQELINDEPIEEDVRVADSSAGYYGQYSEEKLSSIGDEKAVLFFMASWCPSCRVLDGDISNNLNNIPENVNIFTLDYDTEIDLRRKYGVTMQHTLVQVDSRGKKINKWTGGNTLDSIISKLE